jgi:tetratricopeptide (TPR) repeat protein
VTDAAQLFAQLDQCLRSRQTPQGFRLLDQILEGGGDEIPADLNPVSFCLCLAQWVDLGYRDLRFLRGFADRLPSREFEMPVADLLQMDLIHAYISLAEESPSEAIDLLNRALIVGGSLMPFNILFLTHFWKGRAHRKRAEYKDATDHIRQARECAEREGASKLVAVAKIHESWLAFQSGDRRIASKLLDEAEEALEPTGHALSLGNIASARGRFVRRSGDYAGAMAHFEQAIAIYRQGFPGHSNLARALVNAAYVKRLMAQDMRSRMGKGQARGDFNARYLQLLKEGLEMLSQAGEIYANHHHQGGTGSVLVNAGFLHLQIGDFDKAALEAERAYTLGSEKNDIILMARARNLQSTIERFIVEEQLEGHGSPAARSRAAVHYAEEAIELAKHTQNKRLLAEALLARGFAGLDASKPDFETAKRCASEASELLDASDRDHLYEELLELKGKLLRNVGVDSVLRGWSEGQLGEKTFQQVQEEFAEIVIPRVWENCGRNVSRVAKKLSISPKKVRRILQRTGRGQKQ